MKPRQTSLIHVREFSICLSWIIARVVFVSYLESGHIPCYLVGNYPFRVLSLAPYVGAPLARVSCCYYRQLLYHGSAPLRAGDTRGYRDGWFTVPYTLFCPIACQGWCSRLERRHERVDTNIRCVVGLLYPPIL